MELIPNLFSQYKLTDAEQAAGMTLTELNRAFIQNQIAGLAAEKAVATIEDNWPWRLRQAHLQGSIETLQYLLQLDEAQKLQLLEEAQTEAANSHQQ